MFKIVVVDDDPTNITLIKMLLELDGFSVEASADMEQAKAITDEHTDAFLIDYHLARGAKGLDLLHDIRQGNTPARTDAVVVITSGDYRREGEAWEAGANLFLLKPYQPDALSSKLNELLSDKDEDGE